MKLDIKKQLNIFLISSSLPIFLITMMYVGSAFSKKGRPSSVPYELFPIFIPLLFGIFGLINYYIIKNYGKNYSLLLGIMFALVLSSIGRFYLDLPVKIFDFTKKTEYQVHFYAPLLYALIFRFILTPLQDMII